MESQKWKHTEGRRTKKKKSEGMGREEGTRSDTIRCDRESDGGGSGNSAESNSKDSREGRDLTRLGLEKRKDKKKEGRNGGRGECGTSAPIATV